MVGTAVSAAVYADFRRMKEKRKREPREQFSKRYGSFADLRVLPGLIFCHHRCLESDCHVGKSVVFHRPKSASTRCQTPGAAGRWLVSAVLCSAELFSA